MRAPAAGDLDASAAMWGDPDVVRHIGGRPFTREEVWSRILRSLGLWAMLGYGYWAVEEKATGRFVGDVGFADFHRDFTPSIEGIPEMGWVLAPWSHGRGYASEAVGAAIGWAVSSLDAGELACIIDPGNAPSVRVAEKAGFREMTRALYKGGTTVIFKRPLAKAGQAATVSPNA